MYDGKYYPGLGFYGGKYYPGLGETEHRALAALPPRLARIVADELDDPENRREFARMLRSKDPAGDLAREFSKEMAEASRMRLLPGGLGDIDDAGMGKFKFKKAFKKVVAIHKKVFKKVILPYVLPVAGAILAPFTGGASLAAVAAIQAGAKAYYARKAAIDAKKSAKKEAAAYAAEATAAEAEASKQLDATYQQYHDVFLKAGMTDAVWNTLAYTQKVDVVEKVSKGQTVGSIPPPPPELSMPIGGAAPSGGAAPGGGAPGYGGGGGGSEYAQPEEAPTPEEQAAPAGNYVLSVEGQGVAQATSIKEISEAIMVGTTSGDRFEVLLDGKPTGLKIRSPQGVISVPPEEEAKVRAMTHQQVLDMVLRATAAADEGRGGFPWWLLAVPAVFVAAKAA